MKTNYFQKIFFLSIFSFLSFVTFSFASEPAFITVTCTSAPCEVTSPSFHTLPTGTWYYFTTPGIQGYLPMSQSSSTDLSMWSIQQYCSGGFNGMVAYYGSIYSRYQDSGSGCSEPLPLPSTYTPSNISGTAVGNFVVSSYSGSLDVVVPSSQDSSIFAQYATTVFNPYQNSRGDGQYYQSNSILKFTLPSSSLTLSSVQLCFTGTSASSGSGYLHIYKMSRTDFTTSATWNTYDGSNAWSSAGGDVVGSPVVISGLSTFVTGQQYCYDVSSLGFSSGSTYGLLWTSNFDLSFQSSNGGTSPSLLLSYVVSPSASILYPADGQSGISEQNGLTLHALWFPASNYYTAFQFRRLDGTVISSTPIYSTFSSVQESFSPVTFFPLGTSTVLAGFLDGDTGQYVNYATSTFSVIQGMSSDLFPYLGSQPSLSTSSVYGDFSISTTTNDFIDLYCNFSVFGSSQFNFLKCVQYVVFPSFSDVYSLLFQFLNGGGDFSGLENHFPFSLVSPLIRDLSTTTTSSLIGIHTDLPSSLIVTTPSVDLDISTTTFDWFLDATSGSYVSRNASSTETWEQTIEDYWYPINWFFFAIYVLRRVLGSRIFGVGAVSSDTGEIVPGVAKREGRVYIRKNKL